MPESKKPDHKKLAILVSIVLVLIILFNVTGSAKEEQSSYVPYSSFISETNEGRVSEIEISGDHVVFKDKSSPPIEKRTVRPWGEDIVNDLVAKGIKVDIKAQEQSIIASLFISLFPIFIMVGLFWWMMRRVQGAQTGMFGLGKSRARLLSDAEGKVTFEDVAGVDEARADLREIVEFLKDPQRFSALGGKIPRGALLIGPPGTGKTLLARAVAGEAGVPFYIISGSDFVEMFVGVGAKRVRDMFEQAKKNAPCIVFIDEIDAVGRARGVGIGGGNDEREQTLNQLLVEMDGFGDNEGVIVIAATNRKDVLDPALLRPGRFDRQIFVGNPDLRGRERILRVHAGKVPLAHDADLTIIARGTPGFSGADLKNLMNEAALLAARRGNREVSLADLEDAKDKVLMGAERREMFITDDQKERTAFHEAGHAVVGTALPKCDPVYKATIIPRGAALGMVVSLPEMDRLNILKDEAEQKIAMMMAGKAAEALIYGEGSVSNGPAGDIQQATALARAMVLRWGMSDKVGPIDYAEAHEGYGGNAAGMSVSAETKGVIEAEVRRIVEEGYRLAESVLREKEDAFRRLAAALIERETLTGTEIAQVLRGDEAAEAA